MSELTLSRKLEREKLTVDDWNTLIRMINRLHMAKKISLTKIFTPLIQIEKSLIGYYILKHPVVTLARLEYYKAFTPVTSIDWISREVSVKSAETTNTLARVEVTVTVE